MSTAVPAKIRTIALSLLGALAVIVALRLVVPGGVSPGGARAALEREWEAREVLGLTLLSPVRLLPITLPVPAELRTQIERMESYGSNVAGTEMRVTRIEYLPRVPLSLQGSARGAVDALRGYQAVTQLQPSHAAAQVSGVPSIRSTLRMQVSGRPAHGEILTVLRGTTLWQVQVLGPADAAPGFAERVMASVRLSP